MNQSLEDRHKISMPSQKTALILLRTPFQVWLVEKVIEKEGVSDFDIIYFTQNNSPEDQSYYSRIAAKARKSRYIFVPPQKYDVINHFMFWIKSRGFLSGDLYDVTTLASIESHVINAISNRARSGAYITFDDGTANYNSDSLYFKELRDKRAKLYRKIFGGISLADTKSKIYRHYTIQPNMINIVPSNKLIAIKSWNHRSEKNKITKSYFIGSPEFEVLKKSQLENIRLYAKAVGVSFYVRHPRERRPLDLGVPYLDKGGQIAEEAIIKDSAGANIFLLGHLSSVIFNLAFVAERKVVMVPSDMEASPLAMLARKVGCEILII